MLQRERTAWHIMLIEDTFNDVLGSGKTETGIGSANFGLVLEDQREIKVYRDNVDRTQERKLKASIAFSPAQD